MLNKILSLTFLMLAITIIGCSAETTTAPTAPYPAPQNPPPARPYPALQVLPAARPTTSPIVGLARSAELAYQSGNLDQAFAEYAKLIELDPNSTVAYLNRGALYREQVWKAEAIAGLERYLELSPNAADRAQIEAWLSELKGQ